MPEITVFQVNLLLLRMCKILTVTNSICNYLLPKGIQVCNKFAIYIANMHV